MTGFIRKGSQVSADVVETPDVCIIGSGAGGAVTAARLAAAGLDVVVLEWGGHHTNADFSFDEAVAFPQLYMGRGAWATDDLAISILQGRSVGGTTTINWTTCYRTPERILRLWRERHGSVLDRAALTPHWESVEQRLNISPWPEAKANANNQVVLEGCRKLGWQAHGLRRNVKGCLDSGFCGVGCPVNAKQAMHLTYLPDAVRHGARIYANVHVDRLEHRGDRVVAIHGGIVNEGDEGRRGHSVTVHPKLVVLSAGAIGSPGILLRSALNPNGRVGKRTMVHPVVGVSCSFDRPVNGFQGAPQSAASHQFVDRGPAKVGFFIETPPVQPMLMATAHTLVGDEQAAMFQDMANTSLLIALHIDGVLAMDPGGSVRVESGAPPMLHYPVRSFLAEAMAASTRAMVRIGLAAGAREMTAMHAQGALRFRDEADLDQIDRVPWGALHHPIFTAHVMGGCALGEDRATSVVDPQLRHHDVRNLYVVDGSVFPTSLGVNPSETIYGLASWAAEGILKGA